MTVKKGHSVLHIYRKSEGAVVFTSLYFQEK